MLRLAKLAFADAVAKSRSILRLSDSGAKASTSETAMSSHFPNAFPPDLSADVARAYFDQSQTQMSNEFAQKLKNYEKNALQRLKTNLKDEIFESGCVFTGSAGIALLHYLYAKKSKNDKIGSLIEASQYVQIHISRRPRVTFLCGDAGPLAIGAVISHHLGPNRPSNLPDAQVLIKHLEDLWSVAERKDTPDELLYGRVGYLFAILFVNKETQTEYFSSDLIKKVLNVIIRSGQKLAEDQRITKDVPLMYRWHDSYYLGGAHGIAGILYLILQVREHVSDEQINTFIKPTLDWLLTQRYPSGNLPSSLGSRSDRLVQWCHGSPGFVQLLCLAYEIFQEQKYLDAAIECGQVVWQRGLCTKGYSICHGVAGNAYTFLQLYQTTKDLQFLYWTYCFAQWCIEEKPGTEQHSPDAPASLFEGLAGRLYFISDLFDPMEAKFPGFTL